MSPAEPAPEQPAYPDQVALLRLLWRGEEQPSARSGLTTDRIVTAGIELASAGGLDALSMRKVAEHLGVGTMSLYTYVPGKAELVALMMEEAYGDLPSTGEQPGDWRQRLTMIAQQYWDLYQRHPWLLDVPISRPVVGPNQMDRYEYELRAVDGIGLDDWEMNGAVEMVGMFVGVVAHRERGIRHDAAVSGMTDDEWWYAVLPTLEQVLNDRDYPLSSRTGEAVGMAHTPSTWLFDFGLTALLDGIARRIADRA